MSATPATPLSLREARRLEAEARLAWVRKGFQPAPDEHRDWLAARRATDVALVRAVLRYLYTGRPRERWRDYLDKPSLLLDAVEREETER